MGIITELICLCHFLGKEYIIQTGFGFGAGACMMGKEPLLRYTGLALGP